MRAGEKTDRLSANAIEVTPHTQSKIPRSSVEWAYGTIVIKARQPKPLTVFSVFLIYVT
jgi:hypothetical protein